MTVKTSLHGKEAVGLVTATTEAAAGTYTAAVTGAQVYSLADLHRRLTQAYGADAERHLHQDLADGLWAFVDLFPEPADSDADSYCDAKRAAQVPNWGTDDQPLTEAPAEWTARARARRASGPAAWPGLVPGGAARYDVPLTAAQILSFEALAARLARRDGDAPVVRHDLWAGLQAFADLLPEPSEGDVARYLSDVTAGLLPDWGTVPLTETTAEWAARGRDRRAAKSGAAG